MKLKGRTKNLASLTATLLVLAGISGFTDPQPKKQSKPAQRTEFSREFAPSEGFVRGPEKETRKELCLNGKWDFQPIYGPYNQKRTRPYGIDAMETAPDLPGAELNGWDAIKMKVPS